MSLQNKWLLWILKINYFVAFHSRSAFLKLWTLIFKHCLLKKGCLCAGWWNTKAAVKFLYAGMCVRYISPYFSTPPPVKQCGQNANKEKSSLQRRAGLGGWYNVYWVILPNDQWTNLQTIFKIFLCHAPMLRIKYLSGETQWVFKIFILILKNILFVAGETFRPVKKELHRRGENDSKPCVP